jgi:hypothetical protein
MGVKAAIEIKSTVSIIVCVLCFGVVGMPTEESDHGLRQYAREYRWGERIGECLVRGCEVLSGRIVAVGTPQKEPGEDPQKAMTMRKFDVHVTERIYGTARDEAQEVELLNASSPLMTKSADGPWTAWEAVTLEQGARILVVSWSKDVEQRPVYSGQPEDVVFAATSEDLISRIREIVTEHNNLEQGWEEVSADLLAAKNSPLFAGYAIAFLTKREAIRNVDRATAVLGSLLGNPHLGYFAWQEISDQLVLNFHRLSESARSSVTESLVAAASNDDQKLARIGMNDLLRLGDEYRLTVHLSPDREQ